MSGFITFAIVIGLIVWGEVRKNQKRDEQYRQVHPYQEPAQKKAATVAAAAPKKPARAKTTPSYQDPGRTTTSENRTKTTPSYQKSDDNTVYQQMMQTRADDQVKKDKKEADKNKPQTQAQQTAAYRAEANSISTDIDTSQFIEEVYDIMVCGYHPDMLKQRDFVGEGLEMLSSID